MEVTGNTTFCEHGGRREWARRDSNPHPLRDRILNPAWLPVTPLARRGRPPRGCPTDRGRGGQGSGGFGAAGANPVVARSPDRATAPDRRPPQIPDLPPGYV